MSHLLFSRPAYICAVTYITEILLHVTLSNLSDSLTHWSKFVCGLCSLISNSQPNTREPCRTPLLWDAVFEWVSEIGCLMLHATIFQSYMWRHIDVQADWGKCLTYGRRGSERHRHFVGFFNVPVQVPTRATLFIRLFREIAPFCRLLRHDGDTEDTYST